MIAALLSAAATLLAFLAARRLARALGSPPWASPVLVAALLVFAALAASRIGVPPYQTAAGPLLWLLKPAVVALGALLWDARAELRARTRPLLLAIIGGTTLGVSSALLIARLAGLDAATTTAFATRTISTPFAVAVQTSVHGPAALAAAFAVLGGIVGTLIIPPLLRALRIDDAGATGAAMGVSSHLVGTDWLTRRDRTAAGWSAVTIVLAGVLATLVLPLVWRWLVA